MSRTWRSVVVLGLLAAVLESCTFQEMAETGSDSASHGPNSSPMDLVAAWTEMWNDYDLDRVQELFLTDHRVSYFSSEFEGVIRGFGEILEHHRAFGFVSGGADRDTRLWIEGLVEDRLGNAAVLTGIWHFEREKSAIESSSVRPQRGPVTFVCVLEAGEWRFAHMNFGNYVEVEEGDGRTGG